MYLCFSFTFTPYISAQKSVLSTPDIFRMAHNSICYEFEGKRCNGDVTRRNDIKDIRTWQKTEMETWMGRKGVMVSRICRDPNQSVAIWLTGNESQQSTIVLVCLCTAQTNPTDSTFTFNSVWFTVYWYESGSVSFAHEWQVKNVLQRDMFYFYTSILINHWVINFINICELPLAANFYSLLMSQHYYCHRIWLECELYFTCVKII